MARLSRTTQTHGPEPSPHEVPFESTASSGMGAPSAQMKTAESGLQLASSKPLRQSECPSQTRSAVTEGRSEESAPQDSSLRVQLWIECDGEPRSSRWGAQRVRFEMPPSEAAAQSAAS